MTRACTHLAAIRDVTPSARGCEDCLKIGRRWLRLCLVCGHVGCCDVSPMKHRYRALSCHATSGDPLSGAG